MSRAAIIETEQIEPVRYDWGAVKWLFNENVVPGCTQSFGLVHILPGKTNPEHWHNTSEELIYMVSGECVVESEDQTYRLKPGRSAYIASGIVHSVSNDGWEPAVYLAVFSASYRGTKFEDPEAEGARPLGKETSYGSAY